VQAETAGIVLLVLASIVWRGAVHAGWLPEVMASTLPGMAIFFAIGMGFAAASVRLHRNEQRSRIARFVRRYRDLCWLAGLGALVAAALDFSLQTVSTVSHSWSSWYGNYLLSGLGAALLVAPAVFGQDAGGVSRWLMRTAALSWIGLVSYGIFLWHLPLLVKFHERGLGSPVALFATAFVVATAIAAVSYYALELPFLRLKERRATHAS
jgi:peptidoglycan/LPS O-acetylase OafA/YrhL